MNTKTCSNCGWVYPISQVGRLCLICGAEMDQVKCMVCGEVKPIGEMAKGRNMCKACWNFRDKAYQKRTYEKLYARLDGQYQEWLDIIQSIPTTYPTLTEEQWMQACRYFKGCAVCGSEDIDARGFLISFDLGGRYCNWNVIPLCERCSHHFATNVNPYRQARNMDRTTAGSDFKNRNNLDKIIKYLRERLDDSTRINADSGVSK